MYEAILVPTDGSDPARAAARHAVSLARGFDATVHLLSVVDEGGYSKGLVDYDAQMREHRAALEAEAREAIADIEPIVAEADRTCITAVEHGSPHDVIESYATLEGIDLIAMGTHGRTGLDRLLMGSVTERVMRTADVPVLATRTAPDSGPEYDEVLIPTDGSEGATAAVDHGLAIARQFDATAHVLSVVPVGRYAAGYDAGPGIPDVVEALTESSRRAVEAVAERAEQMGVEYRTHVAEGTPYSSIRNYVDDLDVDIVTMGTHGRRGIRRYLLGSVTERTVRTSDVPVVAVRRP